MLTRIARATVVAAATLVPWSSVARAQDTQAAPPPPPPPACPSPATLADTVFLHFGLQLHGHVLEVVPNDHVTLETGPGAVRRIAWSEIDHVVIGGIDPAARVVAPPSPPAPPGPPAPPPGPLVTVHIVADTGVILYHRPPSTLDWQVACTAPCDAGLPADDEYEIAGITGSRGPSKVFHLEGSGGRVTLTVSPPSSLGTGMGITLVVLGSISLYGLTMAALAGAAENYCADGNACGANPVFFAVLAGATLATVLGGVLWGVSDKTDIDQGGGGQAAGFSSPFLPRREPRELPPRADIWRDIPTSLPATPAAPFVPILTGKF